MTFHNRFTDIKSAELALLRQLCRSDDARITSEALVELSGYRWEEQEHRIVFDALRKAHGKQWMTLREELPAHAVRAGFPDVNWNPYFEPSGVTQNIGILIAELKKVNEQT